ncbi:aminoacyl-tRNA deacylase [Actinoplanes sp. TFC3]|uniref:aminoacyl-tRNA deacylase n=1 Tax=Actinoplanes sp. TFC3 TaxID=1710355 RepID=UPI00082CF0B5|nr:YbaK/EbsC family protein [Actinoplanes sp. TFC3]
MSAALTAVSLLGIDHRVIRHGAVASVEQAAEAQGVEVRDLVKTLVVRRSDDHYLFVLVPGDRQISWPKLRTLLGANRLSMPSASVAKDVTGYERGTITPFGSLRAWPVIADERLQGRTINLGAGERGIGLQVAADEAVAALQAIWADVTEPN